MKSLQEHSVTEYLGRRLSRRSLIATAGAASAMMLLAACGGDDDGDDAAEPATDTDDTDQTDDDTASDEDPTDDADEPVEFTAESLREEYRSDNFQNLPGWEDGPKSGGKITLAQDAPAQWDPLSGYGGTLASWAPRHLNQLITEERGDHANNHESDLMGDLAYEWDISDDGLTYTFSIHQGVLWHDIPPMNGRELVADDIRFALQAYKDESPVVGPSLQGIGSIEAPDDETVVIEVTEPEAHLLRSLAQPPLVIFGREHYESEEGMGSKPIGTGPFIHIEDQSRVGVRMERNPNYFKEDEWGNQLPYLDEIETVYLPDPATQLAAFRSDEIVFYSFSTGVDSVSALQQLLQSNPETVVQVHPPAPTGQVHILFNHRKEPWNNPDVRRALSLAIDRDAIIDAVYSGVAVYSQPMDWTYLGSEWPLGAEDLGEYVQYDPERAQALLEEAGYADGLTGTMPSQWESGASLNVLELIQANWREIGVNIEIETPEQTQFFDTLYNSTWEDLIGAYFITQGTDPDNFLYEPMYSESTRNYSGINDPEVDELIQAQRREMDPDARREIVQQIVDIELDQVFRIWAVNPYKINVRQPYVYNITDGLYAWAQGWQCGQAEIWWVDEEARS